MKRSQPEKPHNYAAICAFPGDKSISHRALIFGALATGITRISGLLEAEDVVNTARVLTAMGAPVRQVDGGWEVNGRGCGGLTSPAKALDFGNSGTGVRLMMGVIAGHNVDVTLIGDASLSRRPMGRVLAPLCEMGLQVLDGSDETLPLRLRGCENLIPIRYVLPVASAQVKSAVLLAGLHARGQTSVVEPEPTRDHTERMLRAFGGDVVVEDNAEDGTGRVITVTGMPELSGCDIAVPGDPSSAAFLVAAALTVPGSRITIENVLVNPTRTGFYRTVQEMGGDVTFQNERQSAGEPVADIVVAASALHGVDVPPGRAPSMIDEYPVLAVLAAFATGETRMQGLAELKVKESDRLAATAAGLSVNGVEARVDGDMLSVIGGAGVPGGGCVTTHMDHRIAMAFLIMGLASNKPVEVDDAGIIATSFPQFQSLLHELGADFANAGWEVSDDYRRRWSRSLRQRHLGAPPGPTLWPGLSRYRCIVPGRCP